MAFSYAQIMQLKEEYKNRIMSAERQGGNDWEAEYRYLGLQVQETNKVMEDFKKKREVLETQNEYFAHKIQAFLTEENNVSRKRSDKTDEDFQAIDVRKLTNAEILNTFDRMCTLATHMMIMSDEIKHNPMIRDHWKKIDMTLKLMKTEN